MSSGQRLQCAQPPGVEVAPAPSSFLSLLVLMESVGGDRGSKVMVIPSAGGLGSVTLVRLTATATGGLGAGLRGGDEESILDGALHCGSGY